MHFYPFATAVVDAKLKLVAICGLLNRHYRTFLNFLDNYSLYYPLQASALQSASKSAKLRPQKGAHKIASQATIGGDNKARLETSYQ